MAEALGVAGSIAGLLALSGKILEYLLAVKDSPSEQNRLMTEVLSTKLILDSLKVTVESAKAGTGAWSSTIRLLNEDKGPLNLLQTEFASILEGLRRAASAKGADKLANTLFWPFKRNDIEARLRFIERQKILLALAWGNDHMALSKEIQSETHAIHSHVKELGIKVAEIHSSLVQSQEDNSLKGIIDWITPLNPTSEHSNFIHRRQEGTGQWLLISDEYQSWSNNKGKTLFCPGIPGAGKTILTAVVVDDLWKMYQHDTSVGIAYLYFNFKRHREENARDIFASLLKQLCPQRPPLPDTIKSLHEKHLRHKDQPTFKEIFETLQSVVGLYSRVFILVDALDECRVDDGTRMKLLDHIFKLQNDCGINFFATSRHIPEIECRFTGSISHEVRATDPDMRAYVNARMPTLGAFVQRDLNLQEEIVDAIVQSAQGMYAAFSSIA